MKTILAVFVTFLALMWVYAYPQSSAADRNFAANAAVGNAAEVQLGELAQERGSSDFVREFGAMMERDHGAALSELKTIASAKKITLPTTLTGHYQALYNRLSKLSGIEFDKAYKAAMIREHEQGIKKFAAYVKATKDAELRAFAEKSLGAKRRHLQILRAGKMP